MDMRILAVLAVAATLFVAQVRVLVAAVHRLLAREREDTNEALRQLEARFAARMELMERRMAAMMMPPPPPPPPPSCAHAPSPTEAPPAAQQPRNVEAPQAHDDAVVDRPSGGGFRGTASKGPRPGRLHRIVRTPSAGSMADDDEPGSATGAEARPIVRHASVDIADGPGAQPQIRSFSTRARNSLPRSGLNASFREERSDLDDRAGLPLSPLATPISSGAPARGLRTALPKMQRRVSSTKSKPGKPLSSGALFYARVVERMFEEQHPERRVTGPAGRRLTMGEVHESIIGSPASFRSDRRTRSN